MTDTTTPDAPVLRTRTEVRGRGSREPLIGTGRDDATDVLDRRVEFEPRACDTVRAEQHPVRPLASPHHILTY